MNSILILINTAEGITCMKLGIKMNYIGYMGRLMYLIKIKMVFVSSEMIVSKKILLKHAAIPSCLITWLFFRGSQRERSFTPREGLE